MEEFRDHIFSFGFCIDTTAAQYLHKRHLKKVPIKINSDKIKELDRISDLIDLESKDYT